MTQFKLPKAITEITRWEYLCLVDPSSLDENPRNWKSHPTTQMDSVLAAIKQCGWHDPLLFNMTTNRLLDGHGRRAAAIKSGIPLVPVAKGHWTEEEENLILHGKDTIGSMYRVDTDRFKSLTEIVRSQTASLKGLSQKHKATIDKLCSATTNLSRSIERGDREATLLPIAKLASRKRPSSPEKTPPDEEGDDAPDELPAVEEFINENVFYESDSAGWGIPALLPELLCQPEHVPTITYDRTLETVTDRSWYCHSARPFPEREETGNMGGVLGTFCEDYHLLGFYDNPADHLETLKELDFTCVCPPDYSTFSDWPFPVRLWALYRSRWVARFWQSHGIRILPILQSVFAEANADSDVASYTLAEACPPVVACQCRTIKHQGGSFEDFGKWLTQQLRIVQAEVVVIYGGLEHRTKFEGYLPKRPGRSGRSGPKIRYVYLPSFMGSRREKGLTKKKKSTGK